MTEIETYLLFFLYIFIFIKFFFIIDNLYDISSEKIVNKFTDIVGLKSVQEEINYYMSIIDNKEKYRKLKVKIPKGILLVGPPGTGKTLLVKSIAKKLDIPIISMSGSEFIEVYVGVGASRVRSLFSKAKSKKKCIIFIDEIDAIGKKRTGLGGGDSERDNTLNQLLVEMDGFKESSNILVFAATNFSNNLDKALTRSGRFDKKIYFDPPNKKERVELYKMYLTDNQNKQLELPSNISLDKLSERSAGLTGADIANICNQSKINLIKRSPDNFTLNEKDIQDAIDEVMIGREKRERSLNNSERERVAHHEAGHAFMGYILKHVSPPIKVSIIPRGEIALGFSQPKPVDKKLYTQEYILSQISVLLGGRVAEKIFFNNYSTGAGDDIEKVTNLIQNYYNIWGMSELGPINISKLDEKINVNNLFDLYKEKVNKIKKFTKLTLEDNKLVVKKLANELLTNEIIEYEKITEILVDIKESSLEVI